MAAPTPVSSYLHSAAMVAAGVFLIGRFYPLIQLDERLLDALLVIGALSMAVGGVIALTRQHLKQILAYSTISQYGYIVVMFGLGDDAGVMGASFYVIAHGLAKCALFLTAGAVIEATGETQLERLGGLRRELPLLAYGSLAASATLAALPLTVGFFKDELFFEAALERGQGYAIAAMIGAALTFVYIGRFWLGIFTGEQRAPVHQPPSFAIWAPIGLLAALAIVFGLVPQPVTELASAAASVARGAEVDAETAYHFDTRTENLLALGTYALGVGLLVGRPLWTGLALAIARLGRQIGPAHLYNATLAGLNQLSGNLRRFEVRDLRSRVASILVPAGLLVLVGVAASDTTEGAFVVGDLTTADIPLLLVLLAAAASAIAVTFAREHFVMALVLSGVGFSLATVYAFLNASNVALVAVLIETIFSLLFFGVLALLPKWVLRDTVQEDDADRHNLRDALLAVVAGGLAFVVAWGTLSRPAAFESVAVEHARLTPSAHATNIVSAILADFRGLDTMGEITVIGIALLGIASLLHRGRLR
jgi:multicomponent Na+:H+ antiporter subunit A